MIFFSATLLSLLFGKSTEQFLFTNDEVTFVKRWPILNFLFPVLLAPLLEEIGWRGYGVDSLRSDFNVFYTSLLFGGLWGLWHLPLFFIKGYYQYELRGHHFIYVINFFISMIPATLIINWLYFKNGRSIPLAILCHAVLNAFSIPFKTEQFTKFLLTLLLSLFSILIIVFDNNFFFK
jgi:uncharacterized protein